VCVVYDCVCVCECVLLCACGVSVCVLSLYVLSQHSASHRRHSRVMLSVIM